jgi:hypothetical protein
MGRPFRGLPRGNAPEGVRSGTGPRRPGANHDLVVEGRFRLLERAKLMEADGWFPAEV